MGPLASAAFVRTIYANYRGRAEQEAPIVLLYSNPKVGDRTKTFLSGGDYRALLDELETGLSSLVQQGATELVMCCVTAHYLFDKIALPLRTRLVSLLDVIFQEIQNTHQRCLLACTTGTRRLELFQKHPSWKLVKQRVCLPTDSEQEKLHDCIYAVKRNHDTQELAELLRSVSRAHAVDAVIAGCTELHLLSKACAGPNVLNQEVSIIDPLVAIAAENKEKVHATSICA
jgi:aspartate racemase